MKEEQKGAVLSRRGIVALGGLGLVALSPVGALARSTEGWQPAAQSWIRPRATFERSLAFRHRHTDERLNLVYYEDGRYLPEAIDEISSLLRDFRTDEVKQIDPALLDFLYALNLRLESDRPFEVYSGYRSPETNVMLRREGINVAKNSMHLRGKAIDIAIGGFGNSYNTDGPFMAWIAKQNLPAGKPVVAMINGGDTPQDYSGLFTEIAQAATVK